MSETMFGHYRLDGLIGRGGMGEVHRAFDTRKGDRLVALKLLPAHLSADEEYRARFRREAAIAAQLREPHVIPIHDYGEIDGQLYLDMRLVDGVDLALVIDEEGPLSPDRAVRMIEQLAAALDVAHSQGLIHRDVKPRNILAVAGPPEFVYLADFGIARRARTSSRNRLTDTNATIGTLEYMAPERFLGGVLDHRVDVYALACVLFEALTGEPPYTGEAPALMHGHLTLPVPVLSEHRAGLPPALDDVVARGMAKDPDGRYATAGALAMATRAALPASSSQKGPTAPIVDPTPTAETAPIVDSLRTVEVRAAVDTPVPPDPTTAGRPSRSRRKLAVVATVTALLLASLVVAGLSLRTPQHPPIPERSLRGHTDEVESIAAGQLDGRMVAVTADDAGGTRVWDPTTGSLIREQTVPGWVNDLAIAQLDGRPVLVSSGAESAIRVWDLASGTPVGRRPVRSAAYPSPIAVTELDGRAVIVSGDDRTIRIWDLVTGTAVGAPFEGHTGLVEELTTTRLDNRTVVVSAADDGTVRRWDLRTGAPIGAPLTGHTEGVKSVAVTELNGRLVVVSASSDATVRSWDLATGIPVGEVLRADSAVSEIDVATVHDQPVVVAAETSGSLQLWDLATGRLSGQPLSGHIGPVWTVKTLVVDGEPVAISSGEDETVRIWDLNTHVST